MVGRKSNDSGALGADASGRNGDLWCNPDVAVDLLGELDEQRDDITNEQMGTVVTLIYLSLHKATSQGGESMSLAMVRLISKLPEMVAGARARAAGGAAREAGAGLTKKQKAAKRKADAAAAESAAAKKLRGTQPNKPAPGTPPGQRWPDEDGALGPNGLPRKKGGNPQAKEACARHAAGNCSFKFCSFKH